MPGELESLEEFEGGAAARGDMGHFVRKTELFHRSGGIAAANDGDGAGFCDGLGQGDGASCEGRHFKHTHRSVPDHGARALHGIGKESLGLGADVQAHPAILDIPLEHPGVGVRIERVRTDVVHRQQEFYAFFLRLFEDVAGQIHLVLLKFRGARWQSPGRP